MIRQIGKKGYRIASFIGLTALMGVCVGWLLCGGLVPGPRLVVSDVDIGTYIPGQTIERAIRLENRGWRSLTIHGAIVCCGMSLPGGFPKNIAPRSTNFIVVRVPTPREYTALEQKIALTTNDRTNPVSRITIRGKPDTSFTATPTIIDLGYIVAGDRFPGVSTIRMVNNEKRLLNIVTSSPNIRASFRESSENGAIEIDLETAEETRRGKLQEYIYIRTGIPSQPNVIISILGKVERGLRPRPEQAFFGVVKSKTAVSRRISLEVIGQGWETVQVEPPACDGIEARLEQKDKKRFELHLSLDPSRIPQRLNSFVTLRGSSGDTMQIPILAVRKIL